MSVSTIKSVPADLHMIIQKSHQDDPMPEKERFIEIIETHGVEVLHENLTPLYLAVTMGKLDATRILLAHNANILFEVNKQDLSHIITYLPLGRQAVFYRVIIEECKKRLKSSRNIKLDYLMRKLQGELKKLADIDPTELLKKVKIVKKEQTIEEIKQKKWQNGQTVSLKCPISQTRLSVPGRFSQCSHFLIIFDVKYFLDSFCQKLSSSKKSKSSQPPKCPVCQKVSQIEELQILDFFRNILKETKKDEIFVSPEGTWSLVDERRPAPIDLIVKPEPGVPQLPLSNQTRAFRTGSSESEIGKEVKIENTRLAAEIKVLKKMIAEKDRSLSRLLELNKPNEKQDKLKIIIEKRQVETEKSKLATENYELGTENAKKDLKISELQNELAQKNELSKENENLKTELFETKGEINELKRKLREATVDSARVKDALLVYDAIKNTGVLRESRASSPKRKKHKRSASREKVSDSKENEFREQNGHARDHAIVQRVLQKKEPPSIQSDDSIIMIDD